MGSGHSEQDAGSVLSVAWPGFGVPRYEVAWMTPEGSGIGRHWEHELTDVMPAHESVGFGVSVCTSDRPEVMHNHVEDD